MELSYTSMTRQFATRETGSWRTERPVVEQETCVACHRCVQYCPEGIVRLQEKTVLIDYTFCKGCGICAYECRQKAIAMISE
ncbi:MAG: 4Fe-4S binding protein [Candidatus Tectomicrobia bacterium]|uniref:4Fe-4S binding protein n=1 Tax=Tectimicrobiota bacterium TaxID=2528274 RepID=A0A932CQH3_UNCTE|nr:4Fe-4S binding protein [Candidatus Tectomicrobia bacterium]